MQDDDKNIIGNSSQNNQSPDEKSNSELDSEKIFDITPDLNIAQIQSTLEENASEKKPLGPIDKPKEIPINNLASINNTTNLSQPSEPVIAPKTIVGDDFIKQNSFVEKNDIPQSPNFNKINEVIDPDLKPIRTYESDVADAVSHGKSSLATMTLAEKMRRENENQSNVTGVIPEDKHLGAKSIISILSLIIVLAGIGGAYYFYSNSIFAKKTTTPVQKEIPSLIISDKKIIIDVTGASANTIQSKIRSEYNKALEVNKIKDLILTNNKDGQVVRVTGPEILNLFEIPTPNILTRSISPSWMLGIHEDSNNNKNIFVVFTTDYFQNTFAGMLQWERIMADDLKQYLFNTDVRGVSNQRIDARKGALNEVVQPNTQNEETDTDTISTSTQNSSTTVQIAEPETFVNKNFTIRGQFIDRIIRNKDVRQFVSDENQVLFMYSIVNSKLIVFTTNEATLEEILKRLEKAGSIR